MHIYSWKCAASFLTLRGSCVWSIASNWIPSGLACCWTASKHKLQQVHLNLPHLFRSGDSFHEASPAQILSGKKKILLTCFMPNGKSSKSQLKCRESKSIPQMRRVRWSWWRQVNVFYEGSAEESWHPGTLLFMPMKGFTSMLCHFMPVAVCLSLISSWWAHEPFNPLILSLLKHTSRPRQDKYQQFNPTLRVIKG